MFLNSSVTFNVILSPMSASAVNRDNLDYTSFLTANGYSSAEVSDTSTPFDITIGQNSPGTLITSTGLSNNKIYYRTYITERQSSEVNQTLTFETGTCVYTSLIKKCKRGFIPLLFS